MGIRVKTTKREFVAERVIERIRQGVYLPGHRLPLNSELAAEFNASAGTVSNALYSVLDEGYLNEKSHNGHWTVATATPEIDRPLLDELQGARSAIVEARDAQREAQQAADAANAATRTALARIDAAITALQSAA